VIHLDLDLDDYSFVAACTEARVYDSVAYPERGKAGRSRTGHWRIVGVVQGHLALGDQVCPRRLAALGFTAVRELLAQSRLAQEGG
jgi:hypothetical protein